MTTRPQSHPAQNRPQPFHKNEPVLPQRHGGDTEKDSAEEVQHLEGYRIGAQPVQLQCGVGDQDQHCADDRNQLIEHKIRSARFNE